MIQKTDKLIENIKAYEGVVIICGASSRTKFLIETYHLFSNIHFIFDNNKKEEKYFLSIPIIDFDNLKEFKEALIVICGNHSWDIYLQLKHLKKEFLIEFNQMSKFFPENFFFEVETPDYQSNHGKDSSHIFVPLLLEELLRFNQKIVTVPTKHNDAHYFKKREIKQNSLLFSYHSFAQRDFRKIHFKEGYFFDIINIDEMGYSGWSSLCNDENEVKNISNIELNKAQEDFLYYKQRYIDKNLSKYTQPEIRNDNLPSNFVFIPLQVFNDSVMKKSYFDPIIWLKTIVDILSKHTINIVIKRHPRCYIKEVEELLSSFKSYPNITMYEGSIHSVIKKCDAVYTINSGVGFESLFHLKPVVTFGEVDYQSATFNIKSFEDLENDLIPILTDEKIEYIKKFISYFMTQKNIDISNKQNRSNFVDTFVISYLNNRVKEMYE